MASTAKSPDRRKLRPSIPGQPNILAMRSWSGIWASAKMPNLLSSSSSAAASFSRRRNLPRFSDKILERCKISEPLISRNRAFSRHKNFLKFSGTSGQVFPLDILRRQKKCETYRCRRVPFRPFVSKVKVREKTLLASSEQSDGAAVF